MWLQCSMVLQILPPPLLLLRPGPTHEDMCWKAHVCHIANLDRRTSKAMPHMGSSHSGPAAVASWKPEATPDSTACSMPPSAAGSSASAAEPATEPA